MVYNPNAKKYIPTGQYYFNWLYLAAAIMLGVYAIPFVFRPLDCLQNLRSYVLGFLSYFLMLPMFLEVFPIYAICNLHDVSWGNRPASIGTEAFSSVKSE